MRHVIFKDNIMKKTTKHIFSVLLILCMIFCMTFAFSACGSEESETPGLQGGDAKKELITEMMNEEGEYTDADGNNWEYSFHLPKLNIESDAAIKINDEIYSTFGKSIEEQLALSKNGEMISTFKASWDSYESDGILALVVKTNNLWDEYDYLVYNYDIENDKVLSVDELIEKAGYDKATFDTNIKKGAVRQCDKLMKTYAEAYFDAYVQERRAFTAAQATRNQMKFYYDGKDIHGIAIIGSLAGSEYVYNDIVIPDEPETEEGAPDQTNCDFVWATLKENNDVYVSFEETKKAHKYLDDSYGTFGNFKVLGCYSNYDKIFSGSVGEYEFYPYVFLLTNQGQVEYIDVVKGYINSGTLCSGGPLCTVSDVKDFEVGKAKNDSGKSYSTVYAITSSGTKINLAEPLKETQSTMCYSFAGTYWAALNDRNLFVEISENSDELKVGFSGSDGYISDDYNGYFMLLGMNDEGLVYSYRLYNSDKGRTYSGCFEILTQGGSDNLPMKWISGDNIFKTSEQINLVRSYG